VAIRGHQRTCTIWTPKRREHTPNRPSRTRSRGRYCFVSSSLNEYFST
jgi:hypothetical protein